MDFGVVGLDHGLGVSSSSSSSLDAGFASHISSSSDLGTEKHKTLYGSGFCINNNKQERSEGTAFDDHWRSSKLSKSNSDADFSASKALRNSNLLMRSNSTLGFFDNHLQHQMLSFSSPKPEPLPYSPNTLSAYNSRNMAVVPGFNSGSLVNGGNVMHGEKGLFTPSQWMELEQQALIYKYITANVPNPSNLPLPIRKTSDSVGFSSFPSGLVRPNNTLGWGAFHLGFSNNNDPEPGRCRRTDGKKWRCSKDAVADQKYCERHMNRGRHRSRKPVEGSLAGANAAAINSSSSVALPVGGTASNSLAATSTNMNHQHQLQSLNRMQSTHGGLSLSSRLDQFGVVSNSESQQHSLRQFIDVDWPNKTGKSNTNNGNHSTVSNWPDSEQTTQLSISISSMSSSDVNLSHNAGSADHDHRHHQRQALNLIPMSWEPSLGGPLGEVLHHTNNSISNNNNNNNVDSGDCRGQSSSLSVLNLMTEGWDSSPPMGSSPTGVLQKTAFGSLSNSSAGSSPRADSKKDLVAPAHLNTSSL